MIDFGLGFAAGIFALVGLGIWLNKQKGRKHGANSIENMRETVVSVLNPGEK